MRTGLVCVALLIGGVGGVGVRQVCAANGDPPYQAQAFALDGIVTQVDVDRERVILAGDDGKAYTLDTSQSDITLADGNRAGMTADLKAGMRVHVGGHLLAQGIAEVTQLRVLDPARTAPRADAPAADPSDVPDLKVRGTVDSVDQRAGAFVLRVQDHTRTVFVTEDTDLSGLHGLAPDRFPVRPGDRVSVAGPLQPDGSVLAGLLTTSRTITYVTAPGRPNRILFGRVSSPSNRFSSRDIKIRPGGAGSQAPEVKIKVPRVTILRREGRPISVHDLRTDDEVRATGVFDGHDFRAARVDVLAPRSDTGNEPKPDGAARPGL